MSTPDPATLPSLAVRTAVLGGIIAPVLWGVSIALCGALTPDYSPLRDFISELAAHEAPTELLMRWLGFGATGGLYVAFAVALGWRSRFDMLLLVGAGFIALGGVARVLAGIHACDPGCAPFRPSIDQELHNVAARVGYFAMIVAAVYWGVVGNRYTALRRLSPFGIGCGVWAVVFLVLMLARPEFAGLWQRLATGVLSLWMLAFAVVVYRSGAATRGLPATADDGRAETIA